MENSDGRHRPIHKPGLLNVPDTSLAHPSHGTPDGPSIWEPSGSFSVEAPVALPDLQPQNVTPKVDGSR